MSLIKPGQFKQIAQTAIVNAGNMLVEQAEAIVADIDTNNVSNIYIIVNIDRDSMPTIDIQKQSCLIQGE